ncbi:MAG TPA: DUF1772 domain-containing protein, partial [Longimicrobium sp.]
MIGFAIAATLCAGIFAGAAVYITLVEHPARLSCGTTLAHTEFIPSYKRASVLQAPLALVGGIAGAGAWYMGAGTGWLIGGILLVSVIPITALAILPTNNKLLATTPGEEPATIAALLAKWGRLHAVRTVLGTASFVLFVILLP